VEYLIPGICPLADGCVEKINLKRFHVVDIACCSGKWWESKSGHWRLEWGEAKGGAWSKIK